MIRCKSEQGFTLIEILIAMTLLSIMMVLLFGSLRICAESWDRGEQKITAVSDVSAVINFFQRHLSLARPVWNDFSSDLNTGERIFSFQGKQQSLQFVSSFPVSAGRSGLQLFTVDLRRENQGQALHVTLTPFYPSAEGEQWDEEDEVLIRRVSRFSVAYLGSEEGSSESRWENEWLEKDRLPSLVKITIELDNEVYFPEMIIDLKLGNSAGSGLVSDERGDTENDGGDEGDEGDDAGQNDDAGGVDTGE